MESDKRRLLQISNYILTQSDNPTPYHDPRSGARLKKLVGRLQLENLRFDSSFRGLEINLTLNNRKKYNMLQASHGLSINEILFIT